MFLILFSSWTQTSLWALIRTFWSKSFKIKITHCCKNKFVNFDNKSMKKWDSPWSRTITSIYTVGLFLFRTFSNWDHWESHQWKCFVLNSGSFSKNLAYLQPITARAWRESHWFKIEKGERKKGHTVFHILCAIFNNCVLNAFDCWNCCRYFYIHSTFLSTHILN